MKLRELCKTCARLCGRDYCIESSTRRGNWRIRNLDKEVVCRKHLKRES